MPKPRPVTQEERDRVATLHAQGMSRNDIAIKLNRSGKTVSRVAAELGLDFQRHRTAAATAARVVDARARRAALVMELLDDVDHLRARLRKPYTVWRLGNEGDLFTGLLAEPDARDQRDLMTAITAAIDRSIRLDEYDADPGIDGAKSMLGALAKGLGQAYEQLQAAEPADDAG